MSTASQTYEGPILVGLTGSIGMGKSTVTKQLRALGFPVFDADEAVHQLYSSGGEAVEPLRSIFPSAIVDGAVSRKELMDVIIRDGSAIKEIEKIVHPLVVARREQFTTQSRDRGDFMVFYDIPLLFENRKQHHVDYIIVVSADAETQRQRVLQRPGMTEEKFASILAKQVPDEEKRRQADFIIETNYPGYTEGRAQLAKALGQIIEKESGRWQLWQEHHRSKDRNLSSSHPTRHIDAVLFDLDDTLVPTHGPISAALKAINEYTATRMPSTNSALLSRMKEAMESAMRRYPLVAHDLTELRRRGLYDLALQFGEEEHVDGAIDVLVSVRSDVMAHLYPDVLPFFDYLLREGIAMGILTNGNADVNRCGALLRYEITTMGAAEVGAPKPSPLGFLAFVQRWNIPPHRILYVGDNYTADMVGAKAVGMQTAFINRTRPFDETEEAADRQQYPAADLLLHHLAIDEFERKMEILHQGNRHK